MNLRSAATRLFTSLAFHLAVVAVAAATLLLSWTIAPARSDFAGRVPGIAHPPAAEPAGEAAVAGKGAYPEIAARPLFYPSRTPWAPPPPPTPKPVSTAPTPLTNYGLIGVIVSGDARSALIRPSGANKTITIAEGQQLGGWTLQKITRTSLQFAAGDARYEMTLQKPSQNRQ
jgi:hypothetical protein